MPREFFIGSLSIALTISGTSQVDKFIKGYKWCGNGRKPHYRKPIVLAFIAEAIWNLPTRALIAS